MIELHYTDNSGVEVTGNTNAQLSETSERPGGNTTFVPNDMTEFPPLPSPQGNRYSDVITEGPWRGPVKVTQQKPAPKSLRGYSRVKPEDLYLANVQIDKGESDEVLIEAVKCHANEHGITVRTVRIVKNRYCDIKVGCRIQVASNDVEKALTNNIIMAN